MPTNDDEIKKFIAQEKRQLNAKSRQFKRKGKEFNLDPHGPGIVPDHIYDSLRDPADPKYKSPTRALSGEKLAKIADGDRVFPVNIFVIHHSVGPDFVDGNHSVIAKWYSDVGKSRAYAGVAHSGHYFEGYETFASNHLVGHWHGGQWCIFNIIDDYWNCVSWGAGNWRVNQQAINIENCGRFINPADPKVLQSLANWWRPQHQRLGGQSRIEPHRAVSTTGTACPERLGDQVPEIRALVNQAPAPTPPPQPAWDYVPEIGKAKVQGTNGDDLFFLDAPKLSANIKGQVPEGTIMDYVGYVKNGDKVEEGGVASTKWWKNKYNSYFSERYCKKIEAPAPPPPTPPAPTPPAPTPPPADPKAEFLKKYGIDLFTKKTMYVKSPGAVLFNFGTNQNTTHTFAVNHPFEAVGISDSGHYITQSSVDGLRPTGVHKDQLTETPPSPTPPSPTPTPTPVPKTLWAEWEDLNARIKKALGG